jgi:hypothetical protein
MVGWVFENHCYAAPVDALTAFENLYPIIDQSGNYTSFVSASVSASGLLTYSLQTRPITSNALSSRTGTMQLVSCSSPDVPFDYTGAGALWGFLFTFTVGVYLVSKKAGLILEAVRRF